MLELKLSLLRILALVKKEFIAMWMDPGTRKILFIPVIIQSFVFGYGATFNLEKIPFLVCDNAKTSQTIRLVNSMQASGYFELYGSFDNLTLLKESLDLGEGLIGVYFAPDFPARQEILVLEDGRNSTSAATALGYLQQMLNIDEKISYRYYFNEHNITRYGILSGMILALSMIQVLMLSAMTVSREREEGTFDMLLMTPATSFEILIGKALAPLCVAIIQGLLLTIICHFYFNIYLVGNFFAILTIIFIFSLCEVGVGLAISAVCKSAQLSLVCSFLVMLPSIILSGLLTPFEAMPPWLVSVVKVCDPLYYGIDALQRVYLEGQSLIEVGYLLLPVMLLGIVTLAIAARLFRKAL